MKTNNTKIKNNNKYKQILIFFFSFIFFFLLTQKYANSFILITRLDKILTVDRSTWQISDNINYTIDLSRLPSIWSSIQDTIVTWLEFLWYTTNWITQHVFSTWLNSSWELILYFTELETTSNASITIHTKIINDFTLKSSSKEFRYNNNYLNNNFWSTWHTNNEIRQSLFDKNTKYTQIRDSYDNTTCTTWGIIILNNWDTIPTQINTNTIYLLNQGTYTISNTIDLNDYSAIIWKWDVTIKNTSNNISIEINNKQHIILDNLDIINTNNNPSNWISIQNWAKNITLNNIKIHDHKNWIKIQNSTYNTIDNSQLYNNNNIWVYITNWSNTTQNSWYNIINNISSYNNTNRGLYIGHSKYNTINNSQFYNNWSGNNNDVTPGIELNYAKHNILNNIHSYNNNHDWLFINTSSSYTILNNFYSYNNNRYWVSSYSSTSNKYYWILKLFNNYKPTSTQTDITTGIDQIYINLWQWRRQWRWRWTWNKDTTTEIMSCKRYSNPMNTLWKTLQPLDSSCNTKQKINSRTSTTIATKYWENISKQTYKTKRQNNELKNLQWFKIWKYITEQTPLQYIYNQIIITWYYTNYFKFASNRVNTDYISTPQQPPKNTTWWLLKFLNINIQNLINKFSEVHFNWPWNDFIWSILRLPNKSLDSGQIIELSGENRTCRQQVRWIYYNIARGDKVRPLDQQTLESFQSSNTNYNNLSISWGLFTSCETNPFNIYGQITYKQSGQTSIITAWTKLDYQNNNFIWKLAQSLSYFKNNSPLWYIIDTIWGIWFIWWKLFWHEDLICSLNNDCQPTPTTCTWNSINELFYLSWNEIRNKTWCNFYFIWKKINWIIENIKLWLNIQWIIGLSNTIDVFQKQTIQWNNSQKSNIIDTPNITTATIINSIRKKAQKLCRWKTIYTTITDIANITSIENKKEIICIEYPNYNKSNNITIDLADNNYYNNKTIFIKNANIIIENSIKINDINSSPIVDIFIDKWNLLIKWTNNTGDLQGFDKNWYPNNAWIISRWVLTKWNFIINWLILWTGNWTTSEIKNKLYHFGKIYSLNSMMTPSKWRIKQVENLLGTSYEKIINLKNIFTRECNPTTWTGTDNTDCKNAPFVDSALNIIDNNNQESIFFQ